MHFEKYCKSCSRDTHCCVFTKERGFTFVGISDAKNIQKQTGKEFHEFLEYSPLPARLKKELKEEDPFLEGGLRFRELDKQNRILRLKKQNNGDCIFLKKGKCSIYPFRPHICNIYPFWAVRLLDESITVVGHDPIPSCPIVKGMRKEKKTLSKQQQAKIIIIFKEIEKETKEYKKKITQFVKRL